MLAITPTETLARLPTLPARSWTDTACAALRLAALWQARAHQRAQLAELDERLLRDIGVTPYDAAREAGKPFWR